MGSRKIKALAWAVRWIVVCTAIRNFSQRTIPRESRRDQGGKPPGFLPKESWTCLATAPELTLPNDSITTVSSIVKIHNVLLASNRSWMVIHDPAVETRSCMFLLQQPLCSSLVRKSHDVPTVTWHELTCCWLSLVHLITNKPHVVRKRRPIKWSGAWT